MHRSSNSVFLFRHSFWHCVAGGERCLSCVLYISSLSIRWQESACIFFRTSFSPHSDPNEFLPYPLQWLLSRHPTLPKFLTSNKIFNHCINIAKNYNNKSVTSNVKFNIKKRNSSTLIRCSVMR